MTLFSFLKYRNIIFFNLFLLGHIIGGVRYLIIIIIKQGHYDENPGLPELALTAVTYKSLKVYYASAWHG